MLDEAIVGRAPSPATGAASPPPSSNLGLSVFRLVRRFGEDSSRGSATVLALACVMWAVIRLTGRVSMRAEVVDGLAVGVLIAFTVERRRQLTGALPRTVGASMAAVILWLTWFYWVDFMAMGVVGHVASLGVLLLGLMYTAHQLHRRKGVQAVASPASAARERIIVAITAPLVMLWYLWWLWGMFFTGDPVVRTIYGVIVVYCFSGVPALVRTWNDRVPDGASLERRRAAAERWCLDLLPKGAAVLGVLAYWSPVVLDGWWARVLCCVALGASVQMWAGLRQPPHRQVSFAAAMLTVGLACTGAAVPLTLPALAGGLLLGATVADPRVSEPIGRRLRRATFG